MKPEKLSRRWVLALVLLLVLVLLGAASVGVYQVFFACTRVQASAPPDRLEVQRMPVVPTYLAPPGPDHWVLGASQAQEVLTALDSLPAAPTGTRFCELGGATVDGLSYTFRRGHSVVLRASSPDDGCLVLNLSGCDTRQEDDNFLLLMEQLLNLPSHY